MMSEKLFNAAMLRLVTRADLENHIISRAIVAELLKCDFMRFEDLYNNVTRDLDSTITERTFRKHIEFTNDKFRSINNMDIHRDVTIAQIYEITVQIDGIFYTRIALVHNAQ